MIPADTTDNQSQRGRDCCPEGSNQDCCSSSGERGSGDRPAGGRSLGRTILFVVIVLAAVLLSGRALMRGTSSEGTDPDTRALTETGGAPGLAGGESDPQFDVACSPSDCAVPGFPELAATLVKDKDAVFLILPGERPEETEAVADQVEKVVTLLTGQGKQVLARTLEQDEPGYNELTQTSGVGSSLSVIVLGSSGQLASATGEITGEGLLRAFVEATMSAPACGTSCGSSEACGG